MPSSEDFLSRETGDDAVNHSSVLQEQLCYPQTVPDAAEPDGFLFSRDTTGYMRGFPLWVALPGLDSHRDCLHGLLTCSLPVEETQVLWLRSDSGHGFSQEGGVHRCLPCGPG